METDIPEFLEYSLESEDYDWVRDEREEWNRHLSSDLVESITQTLTAALDSEDPNVVAYARQTLALIEECKIVTKKRLVP